MASIRSNKTAVSFALAWMIASACGGDTTTGHPVELETTLAADPEIASAFATETGWSVKLSKAAVSVGALYYFDGEPAFVHTGRSSWLDHVAQWMWLPVAHAHPGHYIAGSALGQMLEPNAVDLLATSSALAAGNGVTGTYRSARVVFAAPTQGPATEELAGNVAIAEGVATKGEQTVYFRLGARFEDVTRSVANGEVNGCVFDEADVQSDGTVRVTIKPHVWFNLVDFSDVDPGTAEAPTMVAAGETPQIAFALGLVQLGAYQFAYSE